MYPTVTRLRMLVQAAGILLVYAEARFMCGHSPQDAEIIAALLYGYFTARNFL